MKITLREIDRNNWRECVGLKTAPAQERFVATNVFSLAQSKAEPEWIPLAVYHEAEMVGFTLHGRDPADGLYWIARLMIDAAQQGKGYGRAAALELIERMRREPDCEAVWLGCVPENVGAERLYLSLGFEKTGEVVDGENLMRLPLR